VDVSKTKKEGGREGSREKQRTRRKLKRPPWYGFFLGFAWPLLISRVHLYLFI